MDINKYTNYYNDIKKNKDKKKLTDMVKLCPSDNQSFRLDILKQNIDNIDNMNDEELAKFINNNHSKIINNIFKENSPKDIVAFQNPRVLDAFINLYRNIGTAINRNDITVINMLCYHYITLPKKKQSKAVFDRMMELSRTVNRGFEARLLGLGLNPNLVAMLLIVRFSDINIKVIVKRVDFTIINQPKELMSEKMIENIFRIIYDLNNYPTMFTYLMQDVIPEYDDENENTYWVTSDVTEVDGNLGLVILNILNTLPTQCIFDTLREYALNMQYKKQPVRYSLRNLSEDYYRINYCIAQLAENDIYVP